MNPFEKPKVPQGQNESEEVPNEEQQYQQFAESERKFFHENEIDSLEEALRGREAAQSALESSERVLSGLQEDIKLKRIEIEASKSSIVMMVSKFKRIRQLQKDIARKEGVVGDIAEEEIEGKKKLIAFYERLASEEEMGKIMEEAYQMNAEFDVQKEFEEYEGRDVVRLAEKHGVFFVHDIVDDEQKPSANNRAVDTKQLDWDERLDLLLGLEPTISSSTIHPGTTQRTFGGGSWGVFLSGGRALGGEMSDAGTVAKGLRDRNTDEKHRSIKSIDEAISRKREYENGYVEDYKETDNKYNEVVLENPQVAGIYMKWDEEMPTLQEGEDIFLENGNGYRYDRWWDILSKQTERNIPIFVLDRTDNSARMIYDVNVTEHTFKVTPKYHPEDIVNLPGIYKQHLGDVEKRKAAMRVFDKVTGSLDEQELKEYRPDGSERESETSPHRLY